MSTPEKMIAYELVESALNWQISMISERLYSDLYSAGLDFDECYMKFLNLHDLEKAQIAMRDLKPRELKKKAKK